MQKSLLKKIQDFASYKIKAVFREVKILLHSNRMKKLLKIKDPQYFKYLKLQLRRTLTKDNGQLPDRARYLIDKSLEFIPTSSRVLCVGCRNTLEVDYFRKAGIKDIIGIDLYSNSPEILVMDMHNLDFPLSSFDVIYSSHSLEHSLNPQKVIREFIRVIKPGGYIIIEVPVHYFREKVSADLHDFESLENLHGYFEPWIENVLWSEEVSSEGYLKEPGPDVIRTIMRLKNKIC